MLLPPAPAGAPANNAKLVTTFILYSPMAAYSHCRSEHRHTRLGAGRLRKFSSPGMVLAAGLVRVLEGGLGCHIPGTELQSRTLILTCDPAAGYFLFDTAFPQGSKSKATQFCLCLFRPDSKRMPSKIRYARPVACQGAPRLPRPTLRFCPRRSRRPLRPL